MFNIAIVGATGIVGSTFLKIIEEYKSVSIASNILKLEEANIRNIIQDKRVVNNSFLLEIKKNINL